MTWSIRDRPLRRLLQLNVGLVAYGFSLAMMIRADLGLFPWDVLHQGVTEHSSFSFGQVVILTGAAVLLLWIPLRQRPGPGTVCNVVVIGLAVDWGLALLAAPEGTGFRLGLLGGGIVLNGIACAAYIGAGLGPGPRDGLMTGLVARTGRSVRLVRTGIELAVLLLGTALGGTVGLGTVLYALLIGPLVHQCLPAFEIPAPRSAVLDPRPGRAN